MKTLKILTAVIIGIIILTTGKTSLAIETETDLADYIPYYQRALARNRASYMQYYISDMIRVVQKTGKSESEAEEIVRALIKGKSDKEVRELYSKMKKAENINEIEEVGQDELLDTLSPEEKKYIQYLLAIEKAVYEMKGNTNLLSVTTPEGKRIFMTFETAADLINKHSNREILNAYASLKLSPELFERWITSSARGVLITAIEDEDITFGEREELINYYVKKDKVLPDFEDIIGIDSRIESSPGCPEITIVAADIQDRNDFVASLPATAAYNELHYSGIQNIDIEDIIADSDISDVLSDKQKDEEDLQDKQSLMEETEREMQDLEEVVGDLKTAKDKMDALQSEYDNTNWWNPLNWPRYFSLKDELKQAKAEYDALCNEYGKDYEQAKAEYEQTESDYANLNAEYEQAKAEYEAKYDLATGEEDTVAKLISAMSIEEAVKEFSSLSTSRIAQLLANPYLSSDQGTEILLALYQRSPDKVKEILLPQGADDFLNPDKGSFFGYGGGLMQQDSFQKARVIRDKLLEKTLTSGELDPVMRLQLFLADEDTRNNKYGGGYVCREFARDFAIKANVYNIPAKFGKVNYFYSDGTRELVYHVLNCIQIKGEWYVIEPQAGSITRASKYQQITDSEIFIYESDSRTQAARDDLGHPEAGVGGAEGEAEYEGWVDTLPRP